MMKTPNAIQRYVTARTAALCLSIAMLLIIAVTSGCSLKKNTAATRQYTAFITRYNVYFNGDQHYKETLRELETNYDDDFTRTLLMHPAEAFNYPDMTQPATSFTRSIEKAQKAIQLRSITKRPKRRSGKGNDPEYKKWLQREEYNPFLHNAWMMMARSQYLNGDFLGAAATFYYIGKHFWWLPVTVTEAKLWQARSYCAIDWLFEAESILNSVKPENIAENPELLEQYYFTLTDLLVRRKDFEKAIEPLLKTISYAKGAQKNRLYFLLGQLYEYNKQPDLAYKAFEKAGKGGASYRTKFNARIKQSEVFTGSNIEPEVKALRSMTRYGANRQYLDQIYYAIGNLYLSRADTTKAIDNYRKAIKESTRNGVDKAIAQITLGGLYYDRHQYNLAQPCYSEALPMIPESYPDYKLLQHRSDVLDELAVYAENVATQDSLLRLADMSPDEQMKVIQRTIDDLKKREKEEAEEAARQEYLAQQQAAGTGLQQTTASSAAPSSFTLNTDKSWYFYNSSIRNAGRTEFQKRWGSRKLEDNWRRRNKASFSLSDFDSSDSSDAEHSDESDDNSSDNESSDDTQSDDDAVKRAADPHYPEYYLKQIPSTPTERATANDVIQEGLYNMGVILKDKLDDFPSSEAEFTTLLTRYPDNVYRLDVYYNMYLMMMRSGNIQRADHYRSLIISEFPESTYAEALADPDYMVKLQRMPYVEQALYDSAYSAYMENDNSLVHNIYRQARTDYPMSRIMPKFMFLEALSYVADNNPDLFAQTLRELVERYPDTDVSPLASSYLNLLQAGHKINPSGSRNLRGLVWSTRLSNDSTTLANENLDAANFDFDTEGPQSLVLVYLLDHVNPNQLLFDVARHNFSTFMVRDFDLRQHQFGNIGLLEISGFANRAELNHYRSLLETGQLRLPQTVVPLMISDHDFQLLIDEGRALDEYFQAAGDTRLEQIHQSVLPADTYPSANEMYAPPTDVAPDAVEEDSTETRLPTPVETPSSTETTPAPTATPSAQPQKPAEPRYDYDIPLPPPPSKKAPLLTPVNRGGERTTNNPFTPPSQ